ncbi:hypothetical protein [Tateyamaria sp. 1078]|uniref:hypothetical protein n=1 Tax=Tateyamaria sp. 1078 TaxID=3417464 RepID=UPI003EB6D339
MTGNPAPRIFLPVLRLVGHPIRLPKFHLLPQVTMSCRQPADVKGNALNVLF